MVAPTQPLTCEIGHQFTFSSERGQKRKTLFDEYYSDIVFGLYSEYIKINDKSEKYWKAPTIFSISSNKKIFRIFKYDKA